MRTWLGLGLGLRVRAGGRVRVRWRAVSRKTGVSGWFCRCSPVVRWTKSVGPVCCQRGGSGQRSAERVSQSSCGAAPMPLSCRLISRAWLGDSGEIEGRSSGDRVEIEGRSSGDPGEIEGRFRAG